jgi:alpha-galactosidase
MGLWSMMGAPLMISADLRALARDPADPRAAATLAILRDEGAIAIDQDPLGAGGYRTLRESSADDVGVDILVRPLADGGFAFLVLNKGPIAIDYALPLARLGVEGGPCVLTLTDVWSGETRRVEAGGVVASHIASHDNALYRVAPAACERLAARGQIAAAQAEFAQAPLCLEADGEGPVSTQSCSGAEGQQWVMEADGRIRLAGTRDCLWADAKAARIAACESAGARRFQYHRSGALASANGLCLGVDTAKVGNGGLLGQQGAHLKLEPCRRFAPDQTFSAPHLKPPPV